MKPDRPVGIVGYGAYVPRYRIAAKDISQVWTGGHGGVPVESKSVPGPDEDVITMSLEAARNALKRAAIAPNDLSAVWIGSESHPYSVKPSGTVVAEALGATPFVSSADFEFACKAGTEAMTAGMGMVGSGMARYVLAIGADTAQGRPGDALEYTAAAGAAAMIIGPAADSLATIEATPGHEELGAAHSSGTQRREVRRTHARVEAELHEVERELRVFVDDGEIAGHGDRETCADGRALDGRDRGDTQGRDAQVARVEAQHERLGLSRRQRTQALEHCEVTATGERPAGAMQNDRTNPIGLTKLVDPRTERIAKRDGHRVLAGAIIEREHGDVAFTDEGNLGVRHGVVASSHALPRRARRRARRPRFSALRQARASPRQCARPRTCARRRGA